MAITPQEIQSKQFHVSMRGFDKDEVDKFLEKITEEIMLLTLEHKQAFEQINNLEKEIANYRNKEQAFQAAILSAHRISDEMQERSRRESEETIRKAREDAAALESNSREKAEVTILRANKEAATIKELAERKSRETVAELSDKIVLQTTEVNRLIALKDAIAADLRHLLESHLQYLEDGTPTILRGLTPLPAPDPALLVPKEAAPAHLQPERWSLSATDTRQEPVSAPSASSLHHQESTIYERIELSEDLLDPEPMARITPTPRDLGNTATLDITDIEGLDLEDIQEDEYAIPTEPERRQAAEISLADKDDDMFFTLEDPLDDLEPSISIRGNNDLKRR